MTTFPWTRRRFITNTIGTAPRFDQASSRPSINTTVCGGYWPAFVIYAKSIDEENLNVVYKHR